MTIKSTLFTFCAITGKRCASNCIWMGFECQHASEKQLVTEKKSYAQIVSEKI